ncbi:VOC family protein [Candidatus Persebacteraceae bacterium Df01]|jgi:lactoylglutathione lyase|uniref:Aldoketomutase n=1 Tax=Candidatus Doriopsillibacter californiensis TaxID=2970740 RepID=A0ABT7QKW0_9GAMM|nr:VOC family protein [Candidatus Persebacteraceae bacterium Df01]
MKIIHSMVRVRDLPRSLAFYEAALQLSVAARFDFEGFTLAYLRNEETSFELELTHNHNQDCDYELGNGYGHLALSVANLDAEHQRLQTGGFEPTPIKDFFRDDALMARFFFLQDPDDYKIEILQRHGRYC